MRPSLRASRGRARRHVGAEAAHGAHLSAASDAHALALTW